MSILTSIFGFKKSQTTDNIAQVINTDLPANWDKVETELNKRPEKTGTLTNGNFAGFDASGKIVDSTKKPADFQTPLTEGTHYCGIDANNSGKINPDRASAAIRSITTNATLAIADSGAMIWCDNGSALVITIPTNASAGIAVGTEIEILRGNTGSVTITPAGGVTVVCADTARTIAKTYQSVCLKKVNTDSWLLQGAVG